jgi:hypothetical protein
LFTIFLNSRGESLIYLPIQYEQKLINDYQLLVQPKNHAFLILKKIQTRSPLDGILATYAGYLTASNPQGEIIFPRHQQHTPLFLAITEIVKPVLRFRNIIDHFEFSQSKPTSFFQIDLLYDQEKKQDVFSIHEAQIPEDNIVPYPTIIIFGNPDEFEISNTSFPHKHSEHWFLPPLTAKKNIQASQNNITTLDFSMLLRPLSIISERKTGRKIIKMKK